MTEEIQPSKRLELTLLDENGKATTYVQTHITAQNILDILEFNDASAKGSFTYLGLFKEYIRQIYMLFKDQDVTENMILQGFVAANGSDAWDLMESILVKAAGADNPNLMTGDLSALAKPDEESSD